MHEHDQELIMALAEATLEDAAATAAEAEIQTCADCSHDLELQRLALAVLHETPDAYMTATESATLHRALKREVVGATTPPVRKQGFAWGRLLPIFAGTAAVFLVAVLVLPSIGGGDDSADTTAFQASNGELESAAMTETTAASMQAIPREETVAPATDAAGGAFADDMSEASEAPTETTASPQTTTTMSFGLGVAAGLPLLGPLDELNRTDLIEMLDTERVALADRSGTAKSFDDSFAACVANNTSPDVAPSLGLPIDSEPILLGIVVSSVGEELVLVAYVPQDVEATVFAAQQIIGCEVVEILP